MPFKRGKRLPKTLRTIPCAPIGWIKLSRMWKPSPFRNSDRMLIAPSRTRPPGIASRGPIWVSSIVIRTGKATTETHTSGTTRSTLRLMSGWAQRHVQKCLDQIERWLWRHRKGKCKCRTARPITNEISPSFSKGNYTIATCIPMRLNRLWPMGSTTSIMIYMNRTEKLWRAESVDKTCLDWTSRAWWERSQLLA